MTQAVAVPKVSKKPNFRAAIEAGEGVLRLSPCWVPRSFMIPGRRIKLHPDDIYALGAHRGGICERWFASTTEAGNENRQFDEGLSYVVNGGDRFTLLEAVAAEGPTLIGKKMWEKYKRWPVYSKYFDNMGPIAHHMHQSKEQVYVPSFVAHYRSMLYLFRKHYGRASYLAVKGILLVAFVCRLFLATLERLVPIRRRPAREAEAYRAVIVEALRYQPPVA